MAAVPDELPIDVVPKEDVITPRLPGAVVVRTDADAVVDALLADLLIHARNCVRAFGDFHLAISATPEAEPYLRRLLYDISYRDFPWIRTRVWMVDEECVPLDDPECRYSRLRDLVLEQSGIPKEQLHRVDAMSSAAVEAYEAELRQHLGWREKGHDRLDFVLLTLGEHGEIAGFESAEQAEAAPGALVQAVMEERGGSPCRVSLTMEFINASRVVAVIADGEAHKQVIANLPTPTAKDKPARGLQPMAGELRWYVDHAACQRRA